MPVRFLCTECHKLLSVSTRKVGTQVKCPRCQAAITVPAEEEAATQLAVARATHPSRSQPEQHEDLSEFIGIDVLQPEHSAPPAAAAAETRTGEPVDRDPELVTFPRKVLYAQAILLAVVAILAFALGYLSGRITHPAPPGAQGNREANAAPLNS